jgi:hypothetical protein
MAQSVLIPLKAVFDDKGIKQAQASFGKLGSSLKGIVGAAGIAVGLGAIVTGLKDATKAASDDVKSQALLAQQLRNTVGASKEQIDSVEASISAMELQAAVADDVIRPAFASLVRSTGDVAQATQLTSLALDVAAGTGKDLGAVSLALGKAVNGSTTSLLKLVPSIKGATDPMAELTKQFNGAAGAAADNDPYAQLTTVFGRLQEQIGLYLLPYLSQFADYITSPEGQLALQEFGDGVGTIAKNVLELGKNLGSNEFLNGLASFSTFLAQLSSGDIGGAFKTLDDRQTALGSKLIDPATRLMGLEAAAKSRNKEIAANAKKEIAALAAAEKATRGAYNRYASLSEVGKSLGLNVFSTGTPIKGSDFVDDAAAKAALAAQTKAQKAAQAAAEKAAKARQAIIDAAQQAADEAKQAFEELKASIDSFNKSFDATAQGFNAVFKLTPVLGAFEQQAVDAFDTIKQAAQDAFDSKLITKDALASLTAYADQEKALLQGIAKQRDVLAKKISIAQSVTSGIMGSLNITAMLQTETKQVTKSVTKMIDGIALTTTQTFDEVVSGGLADSFKKLVDKTKAFASNLTKLKSLGLNGNLFKQIVDAGAEGGNATAEAIIAGGADAVTELNGLFKELSDAGSSIAETTTPVLYALGEDITNSFIEGLRSEDQKLIDTATAMAALFTNQFRSMLNTAMLPNFNASAASAGLGMDNTDFIRGYGRSTSTGLTPTGSTVINVAVNAGVIANKQELPSIIVDALGTYTKQSGAAGLTRVLGL